MIKRPQSLNDVAQFILARTRQSRENESDNAFLMHQLRLWASDFAHHIRYSKASATLIEQAPPIVGDPVIDCWLGGAAEYLAQKYNLPIPDWCLLPPYFLAEPVYIGGPGARSIALTQTPSAWRRRNLFCGPSNL